MQTTQRDIHGHTDMETTHKQAHTLQQIGAYRHADTQRQIHRNKYTHTHTQWHVDRQTFRHTMIGMHRYIDREIHRDKHIQTQTSQNNILFYLSGMWWALPTPVKFFLGHLLIRWLQIRWVMEYPHLLLVWYLSAHTHLPDTAEATTSCSTGSLWCQTDV